MTGFVVQGHICPYFKLYLQMKMICQNQWYLECTALMMVEESFQSFP